MKIIKVDAIDSTNTFLKDALRNNSITLTTCVWAKTQRKGRGQRGAVWASKPGENLTFSAFYPIFKDIKKTPFVINLLTTISIYKVLSKYKLVNLKIKWPNDILSANKKIGGVLIENIYKKNELSGTVIGIGLNVNQENFENLPQASSIKNILGYSLSLEVLLNDILTELTMRFNLYIESDFNSIKNEFESLLFRYKKPSTFRVEGFDFPGIIQGITDEGKLCVLKEDRVLEEYDLKEIQLKY